MCIFCTICTYVLYSTHLLCYPLIVFRNIFWIKIIKKKIKKCLIMVLIVFVMIKLCLIMVLIVLVVIHKKKMCLIMVLIVLVMIQKKKFIVLNFTRKYILYKMIHLSTHLYGILPMYSIELCSSMLHKFSVLSFFFV